MAVTMIGIRSTSAILVPQGGTGNSELEQGAVLIGQGTEPIIGITGSDGQVLTWISGSAVFTESTGGTGGISAVSASGNLQGDGTDGSPLTLKDNISLSSVTASFNGDGSGITGLIASQISGIISSVLSSGNIEGDGTSNNPLTLKDNISLTDISASNGVFSNDLTIQGNLIVNGTQTIVNTTDLAITDSIILIASGASNSAQLDGAGIHFGRLPSEDARIIYDSSNDWMEIYPAVSSSIIRGSFVGDGSGLTGLMDPTTKVYTASGITVGQVVALSGSLVVADNSNSMKSNVIGVASAVSGTSVTVKLLGEVSVDGASSYPTIGTEMYLGASGSVVPYSSLTNGKYATQVGFISDNGKIILQPRIFGQL